MMINSFVNARTVAIRALSVNILRSGLTVLGIVIGVGAVVVMVALGMGAREMI